MKKPRASATPKKPLALDKETVKKLTVKTGVKGGLRCLCLQNSSYHYPN